jgi:MFS family permease
MNDSSQYPSFRWLILIAAIIANIGSCITALAVAPVLPQIAESLHINLGLASNLVLTPSVFSGCVIMVVGGVVCDRYGVLFTLILGMLCAAVPASLIPWIGSSASGIFLARIVQGASGGFLFATMGPIVGRWFPTRQRGIAGGLMGASIAVGGAAGMVAGPAVYEIVKNWQTMYAWLSSICWLCVAFTLILALMPQPQLPVHARPVDGASDVTIFKRALFSPLTVIGILITFASTYGTQCLYALTSTFLAAAKPVGAGYGSMAAGQLMLGLTLFAGVVGPIVCGLLLDKVFRGNSTPVFLIGFGLSCVFVYLLTLPSVTDNIMTLEAVLILAGFGVQIVFPTIFYFTAKSYAPQIVGKITGVWLGIGNFGGVVGLFIAGVTIKSQGTYHTTLMLQSMVALIGFFLVFAMVLAQKYATKAQAVGA